MTMDYLGVNSASEKPIDREYMDKMLDADFVFRAPGVAANRPSFILTSVTKQLQKACAHSTRTEH